MTQHKYEFLTYALRHSESLDSLVAGDTAEDWLIIVRGDLEAVRSEAQSMVDEIRLDVPTARLIPAEEILIRKGAPTNEVLVVILDLMDAIKDGAVYAAAAYAGKALWKRLRSTRLKLRHEGAPISFSMEAVAEWLNDRFGVGKWRYDHTKTQAWRIVTSLVVDLHEEVSDEHIMLVITDGEVEELPAELAGRIRTNHGSEDGEQ